MKNRFLGLILLVIFLVSSIAPTFAQDEMMEEGVVCDSTLATLILVAEFKYDYLSMMMMDEEMMAMMPHLDFGQYQPLIDGIMAMMMEMMEEDPMMGMSEEEMMAHEEMLNAYMGMSSTDMIHEYMMAMGEEEMMAENMTVLTSGNVADEDPACAEARAHVESFLLAHVLTELDMMMMEMDQ